jgi:hypothetical protein
MNYNIGPGQSFAFFKEAFTNGFSDLDGDSYCEILILGIMNSSIGVLNYKEKPVSVGDCIPISKVSDLKFQRVTFGAVQASIKFKISDNNQNKLYSNMATVTINIGAYVNLAPSQVGDLSISMNHAAIRIFNRADFTTGLNPPYQDPEGDAPSKLRILSLPVSGVLKLNGGAVGANQEISFADIDSALFVYESDSSNTEVINTDFDFAISDTGSGNFTS